jgi:hypothetical protein
MFSFSFILNLFGEYHKTPIPKTDAYRVGGVCPLREVLFLTPISFLIWFGLSYALGRRNISIIQLFFESVISMILTGITIHAIFGVKSKLSSVFGLSESPNGTGIAPYGNY